MSNDISSMFALIKDALNKTPDTNFKDILKFEEGKTYLVRLLPNIKAPEQTFFHYFHHSWKSFATGQFVTYVSPTTFGERCPLSEENFRIYKNGTKEEKEKGKSLYRKENFLVNVYVISDPTCPENEGKVKIMRYGNQLQKIIKNAIDGDDAQEFGEKIFKLTPDGCSFRIKCEKKKDSDYVEYTSSRFLSSSKIEGLDEQKIKDIYTNIFDLTSVFPIKTYDELKVALNEHFYVKPVSENKEINTELAKKISVTETEQHPHQTPAPPSVSESKQTAPEPEVKKIASITDTSIDDLLKGLTDLS